MIEYEELPVSLQEQLEEIAATDVFGTFEAETVYSEIKTSTKTNAELAFLYEVPIELVEEIKEINLLSDKKDFILLMYENNQEIVMNIINTITDENPDLNIDGTINDIKEEYLNSIFMKLQNLRK